MTDNTIDPCEEAKAMNFARANDAETALNAFVQAKEQREGEIGSIPNQNRPEYLVDLLADLRHWARREKLDFDRADAQAQGHFDSEVEEESQGADDEGGEYMSLVDCVASGGHLQSCDDDGYCNQCGHQESPQSTTMVELSLEVARGLLCLREDESRYEAYQPELDALAAAVEQAQEAQASKE